MGPHACVSRPTGPLSPDEGRGTVASPAWGSTRVSRDTGLKWLRLDFHSRTVAGGYCYLHMYAALNWAGEPGWAPGRGCAAVRSPSASDEDHKAFQDERTARRRFAWKKMINSMHKSPCTVHDVNLREYKLIDGSVMKGPKAHPYCCHLRFINNLRKKWR